MTEQKSLGEIVEVTKGKKVEECLIGDDENVTRYIQIDDLRNNNNLKYTNVNEGVEVNPQDLVIAWDGANAGTVGYGLNGIIGSTLARLRITHSNVHTRYLGRFLGSKFKLLRSRCTGATIPHISRNVLLGLKIPLPPLIEQKRIADLLDRADSLRQKRRESIRLLDEFLKSVFIDMFGDPVRNEKGWEVRRLGEIATICRNQVLPQQITAGIIYVDLESIEKQTGEFVDLKNSDNVSIKSSKFQFTGQHILYGKLNPYLNKVALPDFDGICSTDILPIKPLEGVSNKYFIAYLMRHGSFVNYANDRSSGANLPRVNAETVNDYVSIVPPYLLQNKFSDLVIKTRHSKEKMFQCQIEMDIQFHALLQWAFINE